MQRDAKILETWCKTNFLTLNSEKVTERCLREKSCTLMLEAIPVKKINKQKDLGVMFTESLIWKDHVQVR